MLWGMRLVIWGSRPKSRNPSCGEDAAHAAYRGGVPGAGPAGGGHRRHGRASCPAAPPGSAAPAPTSSRPRRRPSARGGGTRAKALDEAAWTSGRRRSAAKMTDRWGCYSGNWRWSSEHSYFWATMQEIFGNESTFVIVPSMSTTMTRSSCRQECRAALATTVSPTRKSIAFRPSRRDRDASASLDGVLPPSSKRHLKVGSDNCVRAIVEYSFKNGHRSRTAKKNLHTII